MNSKVLKFQSMELYQSDRVGFIDGGIRKSGKNKILEPGNPLVTIMMATFNSEDSLEESLVSLINQTYQNIELIIVDGGSTDRTLEIIKKHENAIDYWISEPDEGIYDAWNKALSLCRGDWIGTMGSDDACFPDSTKKLLEVSFKSPDKLDLICAKSRRVSKTGKDLGVFGCEWEWQKFKKYMGINHIFALHSKEYFQNYGLFDSSFKITGDYEILLRAKENLKVGYLDEIVVIEKELGVSDLSIEAVKEAFQAKVKTGNRNIVRAYLEYIVACLKFFIKKRVKNIKNKI